MDGSGDGLDVSSSVSDSIRHPTHPSSIRHPLKFGFSSIYLDRVDGYPSGLDDIATPIYIDFYHFSLKEIYFIRSL